MLPLSLLLQVHDWIMGTGVENIGKRLINSKEGKVTFDKPTMEMGTLMKYGEWRYSGSKGLQVYPEQNQAGYGMVVLVKEGMPGSKAASVHSSQLFILD